MKQTIGLKVKCECFENLLAKIENFNFYLKLGTKFQERQCECVNIQNIQQTTPKKCFKTVHTNLVAKLVKSCRKLLAKVEKVNSYLKIGRKFQVR